MPGWCLPPVRVLADRLVDVTAHPALPALTALHHGTLLPQLGSGIWLKLLLWALTDWDRLLFIDADAFLLPGTPALDEEVLLGPQMRGAAIAVQVRSRVASPGVEEETRGTTPAPAGRQEAGQRGGVTSRPIQRGWLTDCV